MSAVELTLGFTHTLSTATSNRLLTFHETYLGAVPGRSTLLQRIAALSNAVHNRID
ncbi:MAG: hypothetical protein AB4050_06100 [Synechococcus sp.]